MKKETMLWTVKELLDRSPRIAFPEYQREPNIWSRDAKQRLIDSMVRDFDIAPLYLFREADEAYDCVDGRQRIGAILSFFGENPDGDDNGFPFRILNEVFTDLSHPYAALTEKTWASLESDADRGEHVASRFRSQLEAYELTIVLLSDMEEPEEFNLQFARLNLGTILNSGEKLHAMVGDLRDACFDDVGLGKHPLLVQVKIPERRFSREQLAAQIASQALSWHTVREFTRTRHFDLQRDFKKYSLLSEEGKRVLEDVRARMGELHHFLVDPSVLTNRAIIVSAVMVMVAGEFSARDTEQFAKFLREFLCRLRWQVAKGREADREYMYLFDFQRHITQASVEKPAVTARHKIIMEALQGFRDTGLLRGDHEYHERTGGVASEECGARDVG